MSYVPTKGKESSHTGSPLKEEICQLKTQSENLEDHESQRNSIGLVVSFFLLNVPKEKHYSLLLKNNLFYFS